MGMIRHHITRNSIQNFAGILIAAAPILSPYTFYGINLTWILGAVFMIFCLFHNKKNVFIVEPEFFALYGYVLAAFILSFNTLFIIEGNNQINAMVGLLLNLFIYTLLWKESDFAITEKWLNIFGFICCAFMLYQIFMQISTGTAPLGRISFGGLGTSTGWVDSTWGFRFNSLFSEPSYLAIYLLPIFALNMMRNNYINSIVFVLGILLSSSTMGIIVVIMIIAFILVGREKSTRHKILYIGLGILGIAFVFYLYLSVPSMTSMIGRTFLKLTEAGSSNNNLRITGYITYFDKLPLKEQIFGVGIFQLQNYFAQEGIQLANYSNSIVLTLLDLGVIGTIISTIYFVHLYFVSKKNRSLLFFCILFLIFCTDAILLSYRFFYLCYFVMFYRKIFSDEHKKELRKNE